MLQCSIEFQHTTALASLFIFEVGASYSRGHISRRRLLHEKNEMIFNLGQMHLNKLREIKRFKDDKFRFSSLCDEDDSSDDEQLE